MSAPLTRKNLPLNPPPDDILNAFLEYLTNTEVELYDHQEEAILELFAGNNVILNTPTGFGKSLVALALLVVFLQTTHRANRRAHYPRPVRPTPGTVRIRVLHHPAPRKGAELNEPGRSPVYLVHFTQNACADTARDLLSTIFCTKEEKHAIARALDDADFRSPYGRELSKILHNGVGSHHADFPFFPLLYAYGKARLTMCLQSDYIPISRADSNVWLRRPDGPRHSMLAKQFSRT